MVSPAHNYVTIPAYLFINLNLKRGSNKILIIIKLKQHIKHNFRVLNKFL